MGMASWFRRFIPDLARRALPLTHLTQKDTPFTWSNVEEETFQFVKSTIAKAIELHHFDPSAPATVINDASEKGWSESYHFLISQIGIFPIFCKYSKVSIFSVIAVHSFRTTGYQRKKFCWRALTNMWKRSMNLSSTMCSFESYHIVKSVL